MEQGFIWERQKGESEKAYQAFAIYRDMGQERTFIAVAEQLRKSDGLIRRWKDKYNWKERARIYDAYLEKEATKKAVKDLADMKKRHIKIAVQMQTKALQGLAELDEKKISAADLTRMMESGVKLERLTRGESTDNQKVTGEVKVDTDQDELKASFRAQLASLNSQELEDFGRILRKMEGTHDGGDA